MIALIRLFLALLAAPFRSKSALEAENAALRHQVVVLRRKQRGRVKLLNADRLFFVWLYRLFPSISRAVLIIRPDTPVRWHRAGFRSYWRWKSRSRIGRHPFARGAVYYLLRNPIYLGEVRHKNVIHRGEHPAILPRELWDSVQAKLDANTGTYRKCAMQSRLPGATMSRMCPFPRSRPRRRQRSKYPDPGSCPATA